ncbi:MAG: HepT-like ribonuclease domain-containing protein [Bacteroidota bacterium]
MTIKEKKYLFDILRSIELIEQHLEEVDSLFAYEQDIKSQDAVERRMIIISEALRRLVETGVHLPQADRLINRRNTIVHQYDQFLPEAIWRSVNRELPGLKYEVPQLLNDPPTS